ncbi:MAG: response regulator transcription factor [Acidobacteria bacterium]|nr:response regulator transcription factor [Acidobacteriota bacterium]
MRDGVISVVVVEDEVHSRRYLCELLSQEEGVSVAGAAENGCQALDLIRASQPDLVFLDIQMPGMDGFEVIEAFGADRMPPVVFVTAHGEHAIRAFEFEAVDYLRKPYHRDRLRAALERVRRRLGRGGQAVGKWLARIVVRRESGAIAFIPVADILRIESANKYVVVRTAAESFVVRNTMQGLAAQLDPAEFIRIHRCMIVRKRSIRGATPLFHGDYLISLEDGSEITLSRTWRDAFFEQMNW